MFTDRLIDEKIKCGVYNTMEYYSALKEKGNPAIGNNMDESGGYYAKWNKPVTIGQPVHDFTYISYLKLLNS